MLQLGAARLECTVDSVELGADPFELSPDSSSFDADTFESSAETLDPDVDRLDRGTDPGRSARVPIGSAPEATRWAMRSRSSTPDPTGLGSKPTVSAPEST